MQKIESLNEFYRQKFTVVPNTLPSDMGQVNVFHLEDALAPTDKPVLYSRRDFYKFTLIRGSNVYHYADKSLENSGPTLMFFNPQVPYTWQALSEETTGYFCIFRDTFFSGRFNTGLTDLPLFQPGGKPAYPLTLTHDADVRALYEKMLTELKSDYPLCMTY